MKQRQIQKKTVIVTLTILAVIATSIVYSSSIQAQTMDRIPPKITHIYWEGYTSFDGLLENSSNVVFGKVTELKSSEGTDLPVTKFNFVVEKSIKGTLEQNQEITIVQVAGVNSDQAFVETDTPMQVGSEYVLYLKYDSKTNTFGSIGGPQGRFIVNNSMMNSLDNYDANLDWLSIKIKDKPLDGHIAEVSAKIKEVKN